jgi:hypothetical protein
MRSAKKYIRPIDMITISQAHKSVWRVLNEDKRAVDLNESRELSDKLIRKLVEIAREGVIDVDTLRERTLAAFGSSSPRQTSPTVSVTASDDSFRQWRPSSFTQYHNGRTASREDKRPDPKGGAPKQ